MPAEAGRFKPHDSGRSPIVGSGVGGGGGGKGRGNHSDREPGSPSASRREDEAAEAAQLQGEQAAQFSLQRLVSLGAVVVCVFLSALGPICVSDGWTTEASLRQLNQLAVRLFPFGRSVFLFETLVSSFRRLIVPRRDILVLLRKVDCSRGRIALTTGSKALTSYTVESHVPRPPSRCACAGRCRCPCRLIFLPVASLPQPLQRAGARLLGAQRVGGVPLLGPRFARGAQVRWACGCFDRNWIHNRCA